MYWRAYIPQIKILNLLKKKRPCYRGNQSERMTPRPTERSPLRLASEPQWGLADESNLIYKVLHMREVIVQRELCNLYCMRNSFLCVVNIFVHLFVHFSKLP